MEWSQATEYYGKVLKPALEPGHIGEVVAFDPALEEHYLGRTLKEALGAARIRHPAHAFFVLRVGGGTVLDVGAPLRWTR